MTHEELVADYLAFRQEVKKFLNTARAEKLVRRMEKMEDRLGVPPNYKDTL